MALPNGIYAKAPIPNDYWRDRWPNFTPSELACPHCGQYVHNKQFLDKLQALRFLVGKPFKVNSGHRCKIHNEKVGGAKASQHLDLAADISLEGHDRHILSNLADSLGFTGIGYGKTFIHLDMRKGPVARWFYPGSRDDWKK